MYRTAVPVDGEPYDRYIRYPDRPSGCNIMSTSSRSSRALLQLLVAGLGGLSIVGSLAMFAIVFAAIPRSESGFAEGLAILFFGLYVVIGFALLAAGLWIPQRDESGIQFSARQRTLLAYGAVAPIVGVLAVPVGAALAPPLSAPVTSILVTGLVVFLLSGPLATLFVVGSTLRERRHRST